MKFQEADLEANPTGKTKQQDNPFIEPSQQHTMVDMRGEFARALSFVLGLGNNYALLRSIGDSHLIRDFIYRRNGAERYHRAGRRPPEPDTGTRR